MTVESFEINLSMFLINRVKSCRDEYGLTKILAWKFDIIDSGSIITLLHKIRYIGIEKIGTLRHFIITETGRVFINALDTSALHKDLLEKYIDEAVYINLLFKQC